MDETGRLTIYRGPDGRHWSKGPAWFDEAARSWICTLTEAVQDPVTGRWAPAPHGARIEVAAITRDSAYTRVSADPRGEPRIARLTDLVAELEADYAHAAGHPHPRTGELRTALEDVAAIPDAEQRRRHGAVLAARARRRR
ncbi:hypothetical protein [Streptomyces uncialis]|uniref:hypothetical protein n=1 Tax=Streptomyces uncialis TaxID=1048205 RepID=UPI00225847E3|nr:hypothetical protein [Streptomyces uncialis]MCX4661516.1 hypothetical protein [Streptomyces uncialis]